MLLEEVSTSTSTFFQQANIFKANATTYRFGSYIGKQDAKSIKRKTNSEKWI
jgi:hypothetical protein